MKHLLRYSLPLAVRGCPHVNLCAQNPASGYVDFENSPPTSRWRFVEVHIKSNLISMAARLVENWNRRCRVAAGFEARPGQRHRDG